MKLAEALGLRTGLDVRLSVLRTKLKVNAKVQEGGTDPAGPPELLKELDAVSGQLEELVWRINTTKTSTAAADGTTLTRVIARRDILIRHRSMIGAFLDSASERVDRYQRPEILVLSNEDARERRRQPDSLSTEIQRTDNRVQELNWTTERGRYSHAKTPTGRMLKQPHHPTGRVFEP